MEGINFEYSEEKNDWLKIDRGISFEEVVDLIKNKKIIKTIVHPNQKKYPTQKIYIINVHGYAYLVPFVRTKNNVVFLKTIFPSRKYTKLYINKVRRIK